MLTESQPCSHLAFCSCLSRMLSRRWGLGMKAMSPPSFTSRPIHQSLLYFWAWDGAERGGEEAQASVLALQLEEPGRYSQSWSDKGSTRGEGVEGAGEGARGKGRQF